MTPAIADQCVPDTLGAATELKPCPFCGAEPYPAPFYRVEGTWLVFCPHCDCGGPIVPGSGAAIDAWNQRASAPVREEPKPPSLSDARIFELAKEHLGERGHELIWQTDPSYAKACEMENDARWSLSSVRAEQTLALARALEREMRAAKDTP